MEGVGAAVNLSTMPNGKPLCWTPGQVAEPDLYILAEGQEGWKSLRGSGENVSKGTCNGRKGFTLGPHQPEYPGQWDPQPASSVEMSGWANPSGIRQSLSVRIII